MIISEQKGGILKNKKIKKIISILIDNGIDYLYNKNGEYFYDMIKNKNIKKWVKEEYPHIVEEIEIHKSMNKYNL